MAERYEDALAAYALVIRLHDSSPYYDTTMTDWREQETVLSDDLLDEYGAWDEHYNKYPDRAGEWARLGMADVYLDLHQDERAVETWRDLVERRPHATHLQADREFIRDTARGFTIEPQGIKRIGWVPLSEDLPARPEGIAATRWSDWAKERRDYTEAYHAFKLTLARVGDGPSPSRLLHLAELAELAGYPTERQSFLLQAVRLCEQVLRERPPSTTDRGLKEWTSWRDDLLEQVRSSSHRK